MSPSLPPVGVAALMYRAPKPLEFVAMVSVTLAVNAPPPDNPVPAITLVALAAAPRLVLAPDAVLAPVPPSATAKSVMPVIEPPVMATPAAFCTAIVSSPRLFLAAEGVVAPVPPELIAKAVRKLLFRMVDMARI